MNFTYRGEDSVKTWPGGACSIFCIIFLTIVAIGSFFSTVIGINFNINNNEFTVDIDNISKIQLDQFIVMSKISLL